MVADRYSKFVSIKILIELGCNKAKVVGELISINQKCVSEFDVRLIT